jgi:hypothetical protein
VTKSNKILLGWLAFIFVVVHSTAIFIYAFPEQYMPASAKNVTSVYVYPVFDQMWSLFAPAPLHDTKFMVKYYFEGDSTDWIEPMKDAYALHSIYRGSCHGDLAVGESNLLYYIADDLQWKGISLFKPFPADSASSYMQTASYWMTRNFIYGSSDYLFNKRPVRALAECSFRNVKTNESGTLILPEFSWKEE